LALVDYYARCSMASLGATPIEMPSTVQNISSKFQRRMVERDIKKSFLNDLAGIQFDLLLIDFIDERFNLYVEPEGKACTLSGELLTSGFSGDSNQGSRCLFKSEEFWHLWEAGWLILVNKLKFLGILDRVLVNQVFWSSRTESGGNFEPHYSGKQIDSANQFLARIYQRVSADISHEQFMRFDHGLMKGSIKHTWGISPFHYVDAYYKAAIEQLSISVSSLGNNSNNESLRDWKETLEIRMDRIADDFLPFDSTVDCSGNRVALPLFTGEIMEVNISDGVQWDKKFATQARSSVMWQFSLAPIGRLLSTYQQTNDEEAFKIAVIAIDSFLNYSSIPDNQLRIGRIPSGDHSAATRIKVLIKFIQVMRDRTNADFMLLDKVCDCLKYWSDWLLDAKHSEKNNHGLMVSIALLHSAVQFGVTPYASTYLDVATSRIIEHGENSFDQDGLCNENSIGYHNFNLRCYRRLLEFYKHYGLSATHVNFLEELIFRATKALEFCVWQDGSIPPIGDSAVYRLKIPSRNESRCFYESGFAVVKNADLYLSVVCGSRTEFHKQVDDSSITLRFMNRDILIDGGSYLYDRTDPQRRCVESSLGHSGLFLKRFDGLLRSEFLEKFGPVSGKIERFEVGNDGVHVKCVYSVSNERIVFMRNIFVCWPDEVAIIDSVQTSEVAGSSETVQRFLFGSTLDVRFHERDKLILTSDDFSCTLFQLVQCDGDLYRGEDASLVRGWCSNRYKEILPTYGVDFIRNSRVSRFSTIIKLQKCSDLSECSTSVRIFAAQETHFSDPRVRLEPCPIASGAGYIHGLSDCESR
jgi:hypothetical protein